MKKTIVCLLLILLVVPSLAQKRIRYGLRGIQNSYTSSVYKKYRDSLEVLKNAFSNWQYTQGDTLENPYYFYLFSSPTFYGAPIRRSIGSLSSVENERADSADFDCPILSRMAGLTDEIDRNLIYIYTSRPWLIAYNEMQEQGAPGIRTELNTEVKPGLKLSDRYANPETPLKSEEGEGDLKITVYKPNFWTFKTNFSFQFLQNYVSDNWYKGGENYNSLLASLVAEANYNNKQKVTFNNKLEMKIGFQASQNDDLHKFKTNSDLLRLTNQLGLRATSHWYYSFMLQSWTQFHRGYKSNDSYVYSDFMSPFESLFSVGMKYELGVKNFSLNATISPFACDFKYVDRGYLATSFGVKEGKHSNFDYGSNITTNYNWTICKNVTWNGRIYFFTNYSKTQIEWENTFKLSINKYLSTKLFLFPRFDDGANKGENGTYFQFNENLSVGLDVSF